MALLGPLYGVLAAVPVALVLGLGAAVFVDRPDMAGMSNAAAIGALVPPAIRYWRLPAP